MSICKQCAFRTAETDDCPFGLPISEACETAGASIAHMLPLSEEKDKKHRALRRKLNRKILVRHRDMKQCPYAAQVGGDMRGVNCTWGENMAGLPPVALEGSPLYPSIFQGVGGLFSLPMQNVTEYYDNTFRNNPFGLFSLQGSGVEVLSKRAMEHRLSQIKVPSPATIVMYGEITIRGEIIKMNSDTISPSLVIVPSDQTLSENELIRFLAGPNKEIAVFIDNIKHIDLL